MKLNDTQLRAIFWSGLITGLLSSFPLTAIGNCFCCLWAWVAGAGAVYLVRRREPGMAEDAASLGALAGAYAGLVSAVVDFLWAAAVGALGGMDYARVRTYLPEDLPPEAQRMLERLLESGVTGPAGMLASAIVTILLFAVFGALGAALYARLSRTGEGPPRPERSGEGGEGAGRGEEDPERGTADPQ